MAVAGAPEANRCHPVDACLAALEMQGVVARIKAQRAKLRLPALELRVGLHAGPVMAGVVGKRKFTYDIWGDAVNMAALMEANGEPGRINISETVAGHVRPLCELEERGAVATKNKGELRMFYLNRLSPQFSKDGEGRVPNDRFVAERSRLTTGYAG
jgi:class 3 adenylate cyclase